MDEYEYKFLGKWIKVPDTSHEEVTPEPKERIRELLINGTLSPFDFIRVNGQKSMISKHEDFRNAFDDWERLRSVRVKLNRLWKGQLDEIMASITSGMNTQQRILGAEENIQKVRLEMDEYEIEDEIKKYWQSGEGFLDAEIAKRSYRDYPKSSPVLQCASPGCEMAEVAYQEKMEKLIEWLSSTGEGENAGIYVFKNSTSVIYVGQTNENQGFANRIIQHFRGGRSFCHESISIEVYRVRMNVGRAGMQLDDFESMMIFKHSPEHNRSCPRGSPVDRVMDFIKHEIMELKKTGG